MSAPPLPFATPSLSDAPRVHDCVAASAEPVLQSDLAFANIFLLRRKYGTEIAVEGHFLFRFFGGQGRLRGYAFPCGPGDPTPALLRLEEDAAMRQRPLRFCLLTSRQCEFLEKLWPGRFEFGCDPGDADYVYERQLLAVLPGTRYHAKRNHISRFRRENALWTLEPLTAENAHDALRVASGWLSGMQEAQDGAERAMLHEYEAIAHALEAMQELRLFGALLYVNKAPVAMTVASMVTPEVADVHYEKCLPSFRSAYPVINQALASQLHCRYINREEDLNDPGLRKAKQSYSPSLILSKYSALSC